MARLSHSRPFLDHMMVKKKGERCRQRFLLFPPKAKHRRTFGPVRIARQGKSAPYLLLSPPLNHRYCPVVNPRHSTSILLQRLFCRSVCTVCFTDLWLQSCPKYLAWVVQPVPERLIPPLQSPATETPENLPGVIWLQTPGCVMHIA